MITHQVPLLQEERKETVISPDRFLSMFRLKFTSDVSVDLKVLLSYTHPFWQGTVGAALLLEEFTRR